MKAATQASGDEHISPVECRRTFRELTHALAKALGLPKPTQRAVLTLEVGQPPRLELTMLVEDAAGRPVVEEVPGEYGEGVERRIARVQFMLRLEPFE